MRASGYDGRRCTLIPEDAALSAELRWRRRAAPSRDQQGGGFGMAGMPETRFTRAGEVDIAWRVLGHGAGNGFFVTFDGPARAVRAPVSSGTLSVTSVSRPSPRKEGGIRYAY